MTTASRSPEGSVAGNELSIQICAPQITGFGGGITEFGRHAVVALSTNYKVRVVSKLDRCQSLKGVKIRGTGNWPRLLKAAGFCFNAMTSAAVARPHVVLCTHLNYGPIAKWVNWWLKVPYIVVAHGIDVHPRLERSRINGLQNADIIISVSNHTRERLLLLPGIAPDRIRILPNTVDELRFRPDAENPSLRQRYRIPPDRKIVLTVGRLAAGEAYKGYDVILKGFRKVLQAIPLAHYVVCGKGDDRPRIENLVRELGLQEHVTLTGFVNDEELVDHYNMADVFAMPSTGEGFGIVFLEAMACGIPVLAGNRDGSVDALDNGNLGCLVDPLSEREVSEGLIRLLNQQGPTWWFEPKELRTRMLAHFGRDLFKKTLIEIVVEVQSLKGLHRNNKNNASES